MAYIRTYVHLGIASPSSLHTVRCGVQTAAKYVYVYVYLLILVYKLECTVGSKDVLASGSISNVHTKSVYNFVYSGKALACSSEPL